MATRILILGGGFAGLYAARELRRRLRDRAEIELVTAENYFVFQPLLPEVAGGAITAIHAVSPLRFLAKGVKLRKAAVESIDPEGKQVTVFQGVQRRPTQIGYDHLVVALGSSTDLSRTPGLAEHALTMKSLEDARRLRAHVLERLEHADITELPEVKRGALTFTVVGGGFSGIETVGEMKELIDRSLKYYPNIAPSEVRVVVLEFADRILGEMPSELADYASKILKRRGIEVQLGTGVASATGTQIVTTGGEVIDCRTIVATIGNTPSPVVQRMPLEIAQGRIAVERTLQARGRSDIWSLGDCALIPMTETARDQGDFAPPSAQFAVREARHAAGNIARAIEGRDLAPFVYTSKGALASLGAHRGVAEVMGVKLTGLPAWLLWRAYYVAFLPGISARVKVLANWLMDALSPRSVVQIAPERPPAARHVLYRAGDRIYETGTRADGFFTVISGAVEITGTDPKTGEERRRVIRDGGHFGERLLLGATRRVATARALEDTKVLVMNREEFLRLAEGLPPFRAYFERYMAEQGLDWPLDEEGRAAAE
ncbi:MAG: FAD-dependent oxidoreductase [Deinococcus-Thermus bacterium]|jgi:NADH dehydrogenase|nr:FAD-dependent oxidoreductase [Deinococcota bacterium]